MIITDDYGYLLYVAPKSMRVSVSHEIVQHSKGSRFYAGEAGKALTYECARCGQSWLSAPESSCYPHFDRAGKQYIKLYRMHKTLAKTWNHWVTHKRVRNGIYT